MPSSGLSYLPGRDAARSWRQHKKGNRMNKPVIKLDPLYQLLRNEDIKGFNEQREKLDTSELKSGDYRGRDLRNMNASGLDLSLIHI